MFTVVTPRLGKPWACSGRFADALALRGVRVVALTDVHRVCAHLHAISQTVVSKLQARINAFLSWLRPNRNEHNRAMPDPKLPPDSLVLHQEHASTIAKNFDLRNLPPDFYANPYSVYDVLREISPVRLMPDGSYFLTRHADLVAIYRNSSTFSSDKKVEFGPKYGAASPLLEHHTTSLVFNARHCTLCVALFALMDSVPLLAAEREEPQLPAYREDKQPRPAHTGNPFRFEAPPSQLLNPWRSGEDDVYARAPATWRCAYDPRLASDYLLDYPFATLRLMPPRDETLSVGSFPGSPPSQLPNN